MSSAVHTTGPIMYAQMHIVPYDTPHSCAAIPTTAIHRLHNSSKLFATFSISISAKIIMVAYFDVLPLYTIGIRSVNGFLSIFYASSGAYLSRAYGIIQTLSTVFCIIFIRGGEKVFVRQKTSPPGSCPDDDAKVCGVCELYVRTSSYLAVISARVRTILSCNPVGLRTISCEL